MNEDWLDFTNYRDHPTQKGFHIYFFRKKMQAEYFEILLRANGIVYERYDELDNPDQPRFLFGIAKHYEQRVRPLNFDAIGKYREKFIPTAPLRWFVIAIGMGSLLLAIAGYFAT